MTNDLATDNAYKQHINRLQNEVNRSFGKTVTSIADFEELNTSIYPNFAPLFWENWQGETTKYYKFKLVV